MASDSDDPVFKLTYFPLMAKGLGPALCCELSGLPWQGPKDLGFSRDMWPGLKASGKCPFGQLPLLEVDGRNVGQCVAVVNTIGSKAGTGGRNTADFITSQMLLGEAEDLYAGMQKYCPTVFAKLGERMKGGAEQYADWWARGAPTHMGKLEKLLAKSSSWPCRFTADGKSVGELYLWSMLHQMVLVRSGALLFKSTPNLRAFYENTAALPGVANVVDGSSSFGPLKQYFIEAPVTAPPSITSPVQGVGWAVALLLGLKIAGKQWR